MAVTTATVLISSRGLRSYSIETCYSGSANLEPVLTGLTVAHKCESEHDLMSLIKIYTQALDEMKKIALVGK